MTPLPLLADNAQKTSKTQARATTPPQEPSEAVVPSWPPSAVEVLGSNSIVLANGKTHQAREERDAQQQDERSSTAPARRPPAAGPEASDETHAATPAQVLKRALTPAFFSKPRLRALHTYIQAGPSAPPPPAA